MKHINKILILLLIGGFALTGCEEILDTDSDHIVTDEEYRLKETSDSLYSMVGVITQLQKLADSYVLLGELRGDLLDLTVNAGDDLIEINEFNVSEGNKYTDVKRYYSVINNCNYVINNIDTAFIIKSKKALMPEFVSLKTIRAWTYLQMALNFGKVKYYTESITDIQDASKISKYDEIGLEELIDILIEELEPYANESVTGFLTVDGIDLGLTFPPVKLILGDLYLWRGDYELAATAYRDLLYSNRYTVTDEYSAFFIAENGVVTDNVSTYDYMDLFTRDAERIFSLVSSLTEGEPSEVFPMMVPLGVTWMNTTWEKDIEGRYELVPSGVAMDYYENTNYFDDGYKTEGDVRGQSIIGNYYVLSANNTINQVPAIIKLIPRRIEGNYSVINLSRKSLIYLRYAEAVNRLGKPNLAFAVIKNGLNQVSLANKDIIPLKEKSVPLPRYMDFTDPRFEDNIGTAMRGQALKYEVGNSYTDLRRALRDTTFRIPGVVDNDTIMTSLDDSILYVEDLIMTELALETAFEGNRFQDLMRVAMRREAEGNDGYEFLATKVAAKHKSNKVAIKNKLMDPQNWYLPIFE